MSTPTGQPRPPVVATKPAKAPSQAERLLPNGLRVVAVRKPSVPLVELRLRIPMPSQPGERGRLQSARADLMAETFFAGTASHDQLAIAELLQGLGGSLGASVDADRLLIGGSALATGLRGLLEVLADVLTGATYPGSEVEGERERLVQDLAAARSQPGVLAGAALTRRLYGEHPYARSLPLPEDVAGATAAKLRRLHAKRIVPGGATLLLVGDIRPAAALDAVEKALGGWLAGDAAKAAPPLPAIEPGPVLIVDRPGAVQSNLRMAGPALLRHDPLWPALQLANTVFGGYFSSRLVANLREDKGYTYSPRSGVDHSSLGSALSVSADVATEVTAPALLETRYELGRIATLPVTEAELEDARRYAIGTLALATATQAGLASTLSALLGQGLDLDWLRAHPGRLEKVTREEVFEVSRTYFSPGALVTVILGDAARIRDGLGALDGVETTTTAGL